MSGQRQLDRHLRALLQRRRCLPLPHRPQPLHRLRQQAAVEAEAHGGHVAALLGAQQVAGAADLQVAQGYLEPRSQLRRLEDRLQPLLGLLRQPALAVVHQVGVGAVGPPAHAAPQLVELAQPQLVRLIDDDRVDVRDVQPGLDDGGAHQHVDAPLHELQHHPLQLLLRHLPVPDPHARLRHDIRHSAGDHPDAVHPVVHEVDLAAALQLPQDRLPHQAVVELRDVSPDGQPLLRRRLHRRHVADAAQGHVQGARYRRRREGENVDVAAHLLQVLLVGHPEPLLLVDHDQPQVLELHVLLEQAVGAYDDVHRALGQPLHYLPLLRLRAEPGQHLHPHRKGAQTLLERLVVLLSQNGGGHQEGHLAPVHHRLEGRPNGHFRLAVAHVAADQAVHGPRPLHVSLHLADGGQLVRCLHVGEGGLQLSLPGRVAREGVARHHLPRGVEGEEVPGQRLHRLPHPPLRPLPVAAAQPRQPRLVVGGAHVAAHPVQLVGRDEQLVALGVVQLQVLPLVLLHRHPHQPGEAGDAVVDVHHVVARRELGQERLPVDPAAGRAAALLHESEHLRVRDQGQVDAVLAQAPARRQRALHQGEATDRRWLLRDPRVRALFAEQLCQPLRLLGDHGQGLTFT